MVIYAGLGVDEDQISKTKGLKLDGADDYSFLIVPWSHRSKFMVIAS